MKKHFGFIASLCLLSAGVGVAGSLSASAQDSTNGAMPPPKVLVIMREYLKPGKSGSAHAKSESAFVQAFSDAKSPEHYIAMDSLSGKSRSLFLMGYGSFAEWQSNLQAMMKNSTLSAAIDSAQAEDGNLLTSYDTGVFMFQPDKSVGTDINVGQMRYMEITMIKVRPGHDADWDSLAKMHDSVYGKIPGAHWAMYKKVFGSDSGSTYIAISPIKSLEEIDTRRVAAHKVWTSVSAEQKKKMSDLEASTFESIESNLYIFNPKMSYAAENWIKADPDFWNQK